MSSIQLTLPFPPEERWLDIPGWEGRFQVSDFGSIRRLTKNRGHHPGLLKQWNSRSYRSVSLGIGKGKIKKILVHRLVMLAFVGECPQGLVVNHKNGIRNDNRLSNLEYVTQMDNIHHSIEVLGNSPLNNYKLTESQVREIRKIRAETGLAYRKIAAMFNVSTTAVFHIFTGKRWSHVK